MIIDKIKNLYRYNEIPEIVKSFICNLDVDFMEKKYILSNYSFSNIESYYTKDFSLGLYENHHKYIDIQLLLSGEEYIYYNNVDLLKKPQNYNENKDIIFYDDRIDHNKFIKLDSSNFVIIFPGEAHAPQIKVSDISRVKKVVVKIRV